MNAVAMASVDMFKTLTDVTANDRLSVGGKAYNCALLKQAGFPVPDGLVVVADARDESIEWLGDHLWLQQASVDARFAVRSSGVAEDGQDDSFAGIHETFLNVSRGGLIEAVRKCRRSAESEQARVYRAARRLSDRDSRIAVLVQSMVPAVTSGVAFTVNPVTGADELVINSVAGLGEALVSGLVNPEEQRLPKNDPSELAKLLVGIEQFYGTPQDVEWCFDGRQYWIVQSRPVTTRHAASATQESRTSTPDVEWTRANLAEVFPDQLSPQALDEYVRLIDRGERAFFGRLMAPEAELGPVLKSFCGRLYFNLAQLRHVTATVGLPFAHTLRSFGHPEQIRPEDEAGPRPRLAAIVRALPDIARLGLNDFRMERVLRRHENRTRRALNHLAVGDATSVSDGAVWAKIQWWLDAGPESVPPVFVMSNVQAREDVIRKACQRVGLTYEQLAYPHLAAGDRSVSSRQAFDLVALANLARLDAKATSYLLENDGSFADYHDALSGTAFLTGFEEFLAAYGHRGRYESDWALPRLHENPAPVLFAIREQVKAEPQDPAVVAARQTAEAADAWRAFDARLTRWQKLTLKPRVRSTLRKLKQQYLWREQVRSDLTRVVSVVRRWHLVLADRFVVRGWIDRRDDYFLLLLAEVKRACEDSQTGPALRAIAAERAAKLAAEQNLHMPLFMRASQLPTLLRTAAVGIVAAAAELTGLCVSPGAVEADVVVLRDPSEFAMMKRGAILVAPATDPSWTPLFTLASGVIVEVGGMLSHASTIAREYGLPALANVRNATTTLQNGERVRLDASAGRVIRVKNGPVA